MSMKKVSVVMCTYNGEKYLSRQLDSILNQTYPISELYIQDDYSSDSTISIIQEYQKKYPNIRYSVNSKQKGINENFYSAISKATGDYVAISDQDDIWHPSKIEREMDCIGNNYLCFCFSQPFLGDVEPDFDSKPVKLDSNIPNFGLMRLCVCNVVPGHTMLMKRELLELLPHKNFRIYYDGAYAILASAYNKIAFCNEILSFHRRLETSVTFTPEIERPKVFFMNAFFLLSSAFKKRRDLRVKIGCSYSEMSRFLSKINCPSKDLHDSARLAKLLSKQGFFSTLQAMALCVRRRNDIFYNKDMNNLRAIVRALSHPVYHYSLFDYS